VYKNALILQIIPQKLVKTPEKMDDYETLPNSSVIVNMLAGAVAGITEHTVMYPLDSIKVL
jgi:hypothetical protein